MSTSPSAADLNISLQYWVAQGLLIVWLTCNVAYLLHRDMHLLKISSDIHQHALITCTSEVLGCTMLACCMAYLQYGLLPTGRHVSFIQVSSLGVNCSQDAFFDTFQSRFLTQILQLAIVAFTQILQAALCKNLFLNKTIPFP